MHKALGGTRIAHSRGARASSHLLPTLPFLTLPLTPVCMFVCVQMRRSRRAARLPPEMDALHDNRPISQRLPKRQHAARAQQQYQEAEESGSDESGSDKSGSDESGSSSVSFGSPRRSRLPAPNDRRPLESPCITSVEQVTGSTHDADSFSGTFCPEQVIRAIRVQSACNLCAPRVRSVCPPCVQSVCPLCAIRVPPRAIRVPPRVQSLCPPVQGLGSGLEV